jgi:hypothetical protein
LGALGSFFLFSFFPGVGGATGAGGGAAATFFLAGAAGAGTGAASIEIRSQRRCPKIGTRRESHYI